MWLLLPNRIFPTIRLCYNAACICAPLWAALYALHLCRRGVRAVSEPDLSDLSYLRHSRRTGYPLDLPFRSIPSYD
jgi:hypothetical protein